ncbi:unnamed protein product [Ambrosiozyma monospora]|uniref:Unnamed protein product n=1 Tax=Ambrosiozyma monospora TaxID=43982 RepID=A0ACB5U864_AMBMO|nr:unnamed protein product [Ambrosiozyma monospora]
MFNEDEDRFLLVQLYRFGLDAPDIYDKIRESIRGFPLFQFDFYFQSRTTTEINRRCVTLLQCLIREYEGSIPDVEKVMDGRYGKRKNGGHGGANGNSKAKKVKR